MSSVKRPDWWNYPVECPAGHPWEPGRVTVGWMPCDCPNARANGVLGHLWVRCRAEGCASIWYRPRHQPGRLDACVASYRLMTLTIRSGTTMSRSTLMLAV